MLRRGATAARVVVAVLAVVAAGCGGDDPDAGQAATTTAQPAGDTTTTAGADDATTSTEGASTGSTDGGADGGPTIEVLDLGAEPRVPLRFEFEPGGRIVTEQTTTIDQSLGDQRTGPITTTNTVSATVASVEAGVAAIEVSFDEVSVTAPPEVDPTMVAGAEQGALTLEGAVAAIRVDERGAISEFDLDLPDGAPSEVDQVLDGLESTFRQQAVTFPDEAVGVGARWVVAYAVAVVGVETEVEQELVVVAIDDDGVDLEVTVSGTFAGLGEGTLEGSGTMRVSFDSFLPESLLVSRNVIEVQGQQLTQDLTTEVRRP